METQYHKYNKVTLSKTILVTTAVLLIALTTMACSQNSYKETDARKGVGNKQEVSVDGNYSNTVNYDYDKLYFEIVAIDKDTQTSQVFQININSTTNISENVSFIVQDFIPDFVIDEDGKIATKSDTLSNPAIKVVVYRDGEATFDSWLFQLYPDIHPFIDASYHILYTDTLVLVEQDDDTTDTEGNSSDS